MQPITYDGSVSGPARDPLKWFPFGLTDPMSNSATPDPGLGVARSVRGRVLPGQTFPFSSS
jgi:hypothetical protein